MRQINKKAKSPKRLSLRLEEISSKKRNVNPKALKSTIELAIEIAREGREGRKIGTLFTVGDETNVLAASRSLILDPLKGHPPAEKRIKRTCSTGWRLCGLFLAAFCKAIINFLT